ncbi:MAG: hypothetical protein OEX19_03230 [Gammaproteobacteria bacterium]|nr:hypothetical protein [Gammaproteobacteria bacterium]
MTGEVWANYENALKLILTGPNMGHLSTDQRTVFMSMLSQGMTHGKKHESFKPVRNLPDVQTIEYCINEDTGEHETYYYIPDIFRLMIQVHGKWSIHTLPVDLDYLNSLNDDSGEALFSFGEASGHQEWLESPEGSEYWGLLCKRLEIQQKIAELESANDEGKPSEIESRERLLDKWNAELEKINEKLSVTDRYGEKKLTTLLEKQKTFIPYLKAVQLLKVRLQATPEELAAWVFVGKINGGLTAYTNANEFDEPPEFFFYELGDPNYLNQLVGCWFDKDDISNFKPQDRYITGQALIDRWNEHLGDQVEAFICAKIHESRLLDLHPVTGGTQWTEKESTSLDAIDCATEWFEDDTYPTKESALFAISNIEEIEETDGMVKPPKAPDLSIGWKQKAREIGIKFSQQNPRLSILQIAEKVCEQMKKDDVTGRGGRVPDAETIKRHALTGIKNVGH